MARAYASVNVDLWSDPAWRELPPAAQHLYLLLWTSGALTSCGVHDWRPARLAALSHGFTADHIQTVGDCLSARHFLVFDPDAEEVLIRSWVRYDGIMKQPKLAVSFANAYAATASALLRSVLVHEISKVCEEQPNLTCWRDPRMQEILSHPAVSAKDLEVPDDPFQDPPLGNPLGGPLGVSLGVGLPQTLPSARGLPSRLPTPAPAPAPVIEAPKDTTPRNRGVRIPDDFEISEEMSEWADSQGFGSLDLDGITEQFFDYWRGVAGAKGVKLDWPATWRNWVRRKSEDVRPTDGPLSVEEQRNAGAWWL